MRPTLASALALALAALTTAAQAQVPTAEQDHAAHHPAGAPEVTQAPKASTEKPRSASPSPAGADAAMKSMRDMHAKMMAAKTAEERQALMADHLKAMQGGMAMTAQMKGGRSGTSSEAMAKRMDMMEMMMQMMMDREATRGPAAK